MIGLYDVDGHNNFPNLALMKIARYYQGNVEWAMPMFCNYDTIYASKVFTFSPEPNWNAFRYHTLEKGGTGYDIGKNLPPLLKRFYNQTIPSIRTATIPSSSIQGAASDAALFVW